MNRSVLIHAKKLLRGELPRRSPKLQEYFFRQSLVEVGIWGGRIKVDHKSGRSYHARTGWVPIVFPQSLIAFADKLPKQKKQDFFFRGMIYEGREWVNDFEGTSVSNYGRNVVKKYMIDEEYYESLAASRFGLAPTGDCPWSYRFFEAIMCDAIPVLGAKDHDVFCDAFHFYRNGDTLEFRPEWCAENHRQLLSRHTLRGIQAS